MLRGGYVTLIYPKDDKIPRSIILNWYVIILGDFEFLVTLTSTSVCAWLVWVSVPDDVIPNWTAWLMWVFTSATAGRDIGLPESTHGVQVVTYNISVEKHLRVNKFKNNLQIFIVNNVLKIVNVHIFSDTWTQIIFHKSVQFVILLCHKV